MNKIEKIDNLLKDDIEFEKYIKSIDKTKTTNSIEIQNEILLKINKKKKSKYADICKIAACLILSLAICRLDFIKNDDIKITEKKESKTLLLINEKLSDFCKWAITPIEKEEK